MPINALLIILGICLAIYLFYWHILPRFGSDRPEVKLNDAKKIEDAAIKDAATEKKEHKKRLEELDKVVPEVKPKRKYKKRTTNVKK